MSGTGIAHNPGRAQPYTVWVRGKAVAFCATEAEARAILKAERARKYR